MFKDREFAIQMRKTGKEEKTSPSMVSSDLDEARFDHRLEHITSLGYEIGRGLFFFTMSYILLDTFRQVSIAKHTKPTPIIIREHYSN